MIGPYQVLPFQARVDPRAMVWRGTSHSPNIHHYKSRTKRLVSVISRTIVGGGLTPMQRWSRCILQTQPIEQIAGFVRIYYMHLFLTSFELLNLRPCRNWTMALKAGNKVMQCLDCWQGEAAIPPSQVFMFVLCHIDIICCVVIWMLLYWSTWVSSLQSIIHSLQFLSKKFCNIVTVDHIYVYNEQFLFLCHGKDKTQDQSLSGVKLVWI